MDNFISHILVVDDDNGIRSLVKKYLNENNYLVTTADSAENASEKIKIIKFDLIILDIMMPGKSGLEFIEENKKQLMSSYKLNKIDNTTAKKTKDLNTNKNSNNHFLVQENTIDFDFHPPKVKV